MSEKKVTAKEIKNLASIIDKEQEPYAFDYLLLHGTGDAIPEMEYHLKGKTKEQIYKQCLDEGITWKSILKRIPKDAES